MKTLILILSLLLLTSCSNPDTSGGVTLSRGGGGDWDNNFPYGSCKGPDQFDNQGSKTGCGWVHSDEGSHYITSCSNPETWDGVTLSRGCGNDSTNVFPYGSCEGPSADAPSSGKTGCGWMSATNIPYYIKPYADLRGAILTYARLSGANLRNADLRDAYLAEADLSWAILIGADMRDMIASNANLDEGDLMYADLSGASLRSSTLRYQRLDGAILRNADLRGANLMGAQFRPADLTGVKADRRTRCPNGLMRGDGSYDCGF